MSSFWSSLSKLTQCVKIFSYSSQNAKNNVCKNVSVQLKIVKRLKNQPLLFASFLGGIFGVSERETKPNTTEEVAHNVALATMALKDGNIEKSGDMLMKTLSFAELNNFSIGVISTCDLLSSLAIKLGDYEKAEILLIKALDSLICQGVSEDDNCVISFNLKLSRIYSSNGNYDLAERGFKNCLRLQEEKLKKDFDEETFLLRSSILYWYGKFLLGQNRFHEAKNCFKDCFLTSLKVESLLPNQVMVILYNLGEVCQILGENDEAIEHLLKGVSLDKKCNNPDLTYFYSKLGAISMCKGLYKEARLWFDQAQKFAVKFHNPEAERESNECLKKLSAFCV